MQTLEQSRTGCATTRSFPTGLGPRWVRLALWLAAISFTVMACKKDTAAEAMDSDANGYVCLKCGAKFYTDRSVFIGPKCPKCQEESLMNVVGYYCEKDQHLTIRPGRGDRQGPVCEQCQTPLNNAMRSPREKDLLAWGATRAPN